jgi:folate-binding protein YgfZ
MADQDFPGNMPDGGEAFEKARAAYHEARSRGALLDLDRAQWRLTGADRVRYLNGQVTNDIRRATPDAAIPACVTTSKGKLCGLIFVSALPDALRIDAESDLREPLTARLDRYIIADDVVLHDVTPEWSLLHLITAQKPVPLPGAEIRAATRYGRPGWDIVAPCAEKARLIAALTGSHTLLDGHPAESLRIEAGAPRWGAELTEETLPPEARLDLTAIDYHKGCYIGQEVISRIKSVGHVNRMLTGFTAAASLAPGFTIHPVSDPGQPAGYITSAVWSFGLETWAALGYLKRAFAAAPLHARAPDGATIPIQSRDLPLVP